MAYGGLYILSALSYYDMHFHVFQPVSQLQNTKKGCTLMLLGLLFDSEKLLVEFETCGCLVTQLTG